MESRKCPDCNSERTQELLLVWFDCNGSQRMHDDEDLWPAELYSEPFYCEDCGETKTHLAECRD